MIINAKTTDYSECPNTLIMPKYTLHFDSIVTTACLQQLFNSNILLAAKKMPKMSCFCIHVLKLLSKLFGREY